MSKRKPSNAPLSKGLALIHAREILGPSASVCAGKHIDNFCQVEIHGPKGIIGITAGATWEEALEEAQKTPEAEAWQNYKDGRKQAFKDAVDSLRKTIREILGGKEAKLLTRAEHRFVRGALGNLA